MHRHLRYRRVLAVAALLSAFPLEVALAQSPSPEELERARELFEEGVARIDQERWEEAEESFRLCLEIRSSPVIEYNLASALAAQGKFVEAAGLLRNVLSQPGLPSALRRASLERLESVEPRIGYLVISLEGEAAEAALTLDDEPIDASVLHEPLAVDPGRRRLVARGERGAAAQTVLVGEGSTVEVELTLTSQEPRAVAAMVEVEQAPVAEPVERPLYKRPWLWATVGGVVVAAIVVGIVASRGGTSDPTVGSFPPGVVTIGAGVGP